MKRIKSVIALIGLCLFVNAATLPDASRNAAADAVVDLVDAGDGAGYLFICTAAGADTLATLTFSDPAFGAAASGVATASAITSDLSADGTGTAAVFYVTDSDSNEVFSGTVGTSGEDLNLNSVEIQSGSTVSCTTFTYTQPAS